MSQPHRPVYTKNRTTKRKRPRLHGAFKGGFSAGHFNTVGSKNGWTPSDEGMDVEHEEQGGIDRYSKTSIPVPSRISSNSVVGGDDGEDNEGGDYYSRPGWRAKPRSGTRLSSKKKRREQKIEDYMDEEDANDWAGPSTVRQDYGDNNFGATSVHGNKSTNTGGTSIATSIGDLLSGTIQAQNGPIGKQLLRVLGWRENINAGGDGKKSYLYVPMDEDEKDDSVKNRFLSSRRLKRIELKLSKHESQRLPDPKLDTYGLGYEPFRGAPEFKAHKEMRKRRAEMRAIAATSKHGDERINVYRTSALKGIKDSGKFSTAKEEGGMVGVTNTRHSHKIVDAQGDVLAYETSEDFVGSKTVGGFALHDDDDDVYDDPMGDANGKKIGKGAETKPKIDEEEYHNEVFEASDSDGERYNFPHAENKSQNGVNINIFEGALNAWATGDGNSTLGSHKTKKVAAVTSDGKPPLRGFLLGGDGVKSKRFPGPDVPPDYAVKRHVFPSSDTLDGMKALSAKMKLQINSRKRSEIFESREPNLSGIRRDMRPMAGGSFAALSSSLKDRFTSSTNANDKSGENAKIGLTAPSDPTRVIIVRKTIEWQPSSLLCKRLGVNTPRVTKAGSQVSVSVPNSSNSETREQSFFREEVLGKIDKNTSSEKQRDAVDELPLSEEKLDVERPTMQFMKAIFEPDSDDSMSISDDSSNEPFEVTENIEDKQQIDHETQTNKLLEDAKVVDEPNKHSFSSSSEDTDDDRRKRRKRHRRKDKKHRKRKKERREADRRKGRKRDRRK